MARTRIQNRRMIQRVMPHLRQLETNTNNDYFPEVVSFGPYHHGEPKLAFVEAFKPKALQLFISNSTGDEQFYHSRVLDIIDEIRDCYEQETTAKYSDDELARMMLRDASMIIIYMETIAWAREPNESILEKQWAMSEHIGILCIQIMGRDLRLLENQIPLFLIKFLIDLRYGGGMKNELVNRYIIATFLGEYREESLQTKFEGDEPLHLLEAIHRLLFLDSGKQLEKISDKCKWLCFSGADPEIGVGSSITYANPGFLHRLQKFFSWKGENKYKIKDAIPVFRSATDLKAKGIYFKPSPTQSLNDVSFQSHFFYARLQLPPVVMSTNTKVSWKNMVAYELSPNSPGMAKLLSYISFMKSLVEKPEDVKELRERRILCNMLGSDEEVLDLFKYINTRWTNAVLFQNVNDQIHAHCNSRMKTWMAEIIHNNFRSAWTMTAFVAAVALLGISAAQLYYAVHPN